MPIVIPPDVAKTLLPRRPEDAGKPKRVTVKTAWARVREDIEGFRNRYVEAIATDFAFVTMRESAPEELRPRMEALHAFALREEAPAAGEWSIATASALLSYTYRAIDFLDALCGPTMAFEARIDSLRYGLTRQNKGLHLSHSDGIADLGLRSRLLQATPEIRASCRDIAKRVWANESTLFHQRLTLAYTFFDEAEWCDAVAKQYAADDTLVRRTPIEALYAIVPNLEIARAVHAKRLAARTYLELVVSIGDDAFELLAEAFTTPKDEWDQRHAAAALAVFDDRRAAELLVTGLGSAKVRPSIVEFCVRFPKTGRAALEPLAAKGKGRVGKFANELLATIAKTEESAAAAAATTDDVGDDPTLNNDDAEAQTSNPSTVEEASPEELPWILVKPPWLDRKKIPKRKADAARPTMKEVAILEREEHVRLSPVLQKAAREVLNPNASTYEPSVALATTTSDAKLVDGHGARLDDQTIFDQWTRGGGFNVLDGDRACDHLLYILSRFGVKAIDGLVKYFEKNNDMRSHRGNKKALLAVDSPRIALGLSVRITEDSRYWEDVWGPHARLWMQTYPETAVIGLVPAVLEGDACGRGEKAKTAERSLRFLRDHHNVDVLSIAKPYGAEACSILEEVLSWDARFDLPARLPKMPVAYRPESMTRPLLRESGKRLPLSAVAHLGTMLSLTDNRLPYPGIFDVKAVCDPRSLAEHAWDLARSWEMGGSKSSHEWMLQSLVHFADDEVVRRTTPAMRSQSVANVLQTIGSDAAVMELVTIGARGAAGNVGYSWASNVIERRLDAIAATRSGDMTGEELEESILPIREVDYKLQLDYGGRVLDVGFDERLDVFVAAEDGTRLRALPPGRKTDDKKKVEESKRIWQDLKEEVSAVVRRRLLHLERSMIRGTTWTFADLARRYIDHPLLKHIGRTLVWQVKQGDHPYRRFRITEDATFADVNDEPITNLLDRTETALALVGLAHPARMDRSEADKWVQLLFDYRIVQPFTQMGRAIRELTDAERTERIFSRTPKETLRSEDFTQRLHDRGYVNGRKKLSQGEAVLVLTYGNRTVNSISLKLLPPWLDFDHVEIAECLMDIDV